MRTTKDLTPQEIIDYFKSREGLVQEMLYPNPGEPQLNQSILYDPDRWEQECLMQGPFCSDCFPLRDGVVEGCGDPDECLVWVFYPNYGDAAGEDVPDWPDEFRCRLVDGRIMYDAD